MRMQSLKQAVLVEGQGAGFGIKLWSGSEMLDVIARHEHVRAQVIGSSTAVTINRLSES
jgi:hypothetical protein